MIDLGAVAVEEPPADVADHSLVEEASPFGRCDLGSLVEVKAIVTTAHTYQGHVRGYGELQGARYRRVFPQHPRGLVTAHDDRCVQMFGRSAEGRSEGIGRLVRVSAAVTARRQGASERDKGRAGEPGV